jgi:hypothetical protein
MTPIIGGFCGMQLTENSDESAIRSQKADRVSKKVRKIGLTLTDKHFYIMRYMITIR